jgi:predicted ATP-dependent endonuclease of OLD family
MEITLKNELDIFERTKFELVEGMTILAGCNGSGKSTLLEELRDFFKSKDIKFSYLDCNEAFHFQDINSIDNMYSLSVALQKAWCSEHEHYENMFSQWVSNVRPPDGMKEYGIFIDGLDSGSDVYNFARHIEFFNMVLSDAERRKIKLYLVVTCNNFYYLSSTLKGEVIYLPVMERKNLPAYTTEQFDNYVEDIFTTVKMRGFIK